MTPSGCPVTPGFPIRKSPDQSSFDSSPGLIAAYHVLHRLSTPRHPPCTLSSLTTLIRGCQPKARCSRTTLRRPTSRMHQANLFQRFENLVITPPTCARGTCRQRDHSELMVLRHNTVWPVSHTSPCKQGRVRPTDLRPCLQLSKSLRALPIASSHRQAEPSRVPRRNRSSSAPIAFFSSAADRSRMCKTRNENDTKAV